MEKLTFSVAEYDAPLDLILHLLQKNKLSILDIEISSLLEQYMDAIALMSEQDLELASEFLEMASRLVHIKTVSLLPKHKEDEDKLRQELSGQLIEYAMCKIAASNLGEHFKGQDIFVREAARIEIDPTYELTHDAQELVDAIIDVMGKEARRLPPPREAFDPLVTRPVASVTAKIFAVLRALRLRGPASLQKLYHASTDRSGVIATFLAVLELIKAGKVSMEGEEVQLSGDN